MGFDINRRTFLGSAVATGVVSVVPRHVLGGAGYVAPSEKITLAQVGMGTQGFNELGGLLADPQIQIVAVCDPNTDSNDYVEWGKHSIRNRIRTYLGDPDWRENASGAPGGREVGRLVVDTYYKNQRAAENFKACAAYADFRELLEQETDLDAVKVMTPDHLHATVCIAAMRKGKHVMVHKPLANRLAEGRLVVDTARQTRRATHLLAYGSGSANGLICRRIKQGVIGKLREVHNWTNRPVWPQYTEIPQDRPPVPKGFDWDLWLGPAVDRPYHPNYTHTVFRGWYDFGGGSMADMGIYSLWPVFTALDLEAPLSAEAWATHTCAVADHVSRPLANDFAYPTGCTIRLKFAARGEMPELDLFWYDGGMRPRLPAEVEAEGIEMAREGILYVGDEGSILAGFQGQSPQLFAKGRRDALALEETQAGARHGSWLGEVRGGAPSPGSFLNAASITDAVNLGTVALRARKKVLFDSANMKITNLADGDKYLRREYRNGWEL
ncbi:MAG: Gfo/Idh/MocA family oxidoreductase [Pirellulaceae bacterium]|jgi:predicted dehydrogenase|nr:Gfo/Idh/MocA family oxidoreductase [Thermoguttaceae bacterium]MDI9443353.1 Gfo/Idh/MocA family oxidoreductase [Planctomycetota bacterium]NLZ01098.1 Gfo/Idh/MocA family oxidoreductase [Pirellulaceae bacterium]